MSGVASANPSDDILRISLRLLKNSAFPVKILGNYFFRTSLNGLLSHHRQFSHQCELVFFD